MQDSQFMRIKRVPNGTVAVVRYGNQLAIETWIGDKRSTVETFESDGSRGDAIAVRSLAFGCCDSVAADLRHNQ
jgi:hypothetical protein